MAVSQRMIDTNIAMAENKFRGRKWKTDEVRKLMTNPGTIAREPCFICGKHLDITVLHHVVQVSELTRYLNEGIICVDDVDSPVVWLCPNCHAYLHEILGGNTGVACSMIENDLEKAYLYDVMKARIDHLDKIFDRSERRLMSLGYEFGETEGT